MSQYDPAVFTLRLYPGFPFIEGGVEHPGILVHTCKGGWTVVYPNPGGVIPFVVLLTNAFVAASTGGVNRISVFVIWYRLTEIDDRSMRRARLHHYLQEWVAP